MDWMAWYQSLAKPSWTPTPDTISLIWRILYPIIVISFGYVFVQAARKRVPAKQCIPFAINLVANLAFTPIQFGLKSLPLACIDIAIVWFTILWASVAIWRYAKWVSFAQIPYFVWVTIAMVLQFSITWMNR